MSARAWRFVAAVRRHPVAADSVVAVAFSAGSLVSLYATFELLRQDPKFHEPAKAGIVLALLTVTVPVALRRRFPLAVASVVIVAFVVGRGRATRVCRVWLRGRER